MRKASTPNQDPSQTRVILDLEPEHLSVLMETIGAVVVQYGIGVNVIPPPDAPAQKTAAREESPHYNQKYITLLPETDGSDEMVPVVTQQSLGIFSYHTGRPIGGATRFMTYLGLHAHEHPEFQPRLYGHDSEDTFVASGIRVDSIGRLEHELAVGKLKIPLIGVSSSQLLSDFCDEFFITDPETE